MGAVTLWGWDRGAKIYRKVLVHPTGYLQTVVMSSLLPAGAATEVTLDLVRAELDGIEGLLAGGLPAALDTGALKVREQNWPADPATGGRQDVQTDLISLIYTLLGIRLPAILSVSSATTGKVSVGAVSTAVLAANATRIFADFVNDSDEVIYLDLSDTAVMNEGIRLNANGGAFEIGFTNLYTGAIAAICASGGKNLTVTEG